MTDYKRCRPCLGTQIQVEVWAVSEARRDFVEEIVSRAFDLATEVSKTFSLFDADSELCRFNRTEPGAAFVASPMFFSVLREAEGIQKLSGGAFDIFSTTDRSSDDGALEFKTELRAHHVTKRRACELDLNGIAKGHAVDVLVTQLRHELPGCSGVVNAGGDLRFLTAGRHEVSLRLGDIETPLVRPFETVTESVATSSLSVSRSRSESSTRYKKPLRVGLAENFSAVTLSERCAVADALTKVALFADPLEIGCCAKALDADILIFDGQGKLVEIYENSAAV